MTLDRTTTIGELLASHPEAGEALLEIGMHCLGCPASQRESLEAAAATHGKDVEELLAKIQSKISA